MLLRRPSLFTGRFAILVVGLWALAAAAANLAVPQLERVVDTHARAFMPADASSSVAASRAAELFAQNPATTSFMLCWNAIRDSRRLTASSMTR